MIDFSVRGAVRRLLRPLVNPRLGRLRIHRPRPVRLPVWLPGSRHSSQDPLISIVTPSFRQARFIERTIGSVLQNGYQQLEYVVMDGGSDDGTVAILERYADQLAYWQSAPDGGQTAAINAGFARARAGEIMAYLNSDDMFVPGALQIVANFFAHHPEVDVVYGHRLLVDEQDREIGRWILPPHDHDVLRWADFVPQETLFWRRSLWEQVGGQLDESFRFAMDWDLLLRFQTAGARFVRLPYILGAFRVHSSQKTSQELESAGYAEMQRLRTRCHGRDITQAEVTAAIRPYLIRHLLWDRTNRFVDLFRRRENVALGGLAHSVATLDCSPFASHE